MQLQSHPISSHRSFICEEPVSTDYVTHAISPAFKPGTASTEMLSFTPYINVCFHHTHKHILNIETDMHKHTPLTWAHT